MSERQELRDVQDKKPSEVHTGRSEAGDNRAAHFEGRDSASAQSAGRVNEARSERGTPETAAHHSSDDHPGNNDNLGSGRSRSHRNAPGQSKTRGNAGKKG